ncbi:MAG: hypothetical protein MJZ20_00190 [Bacteroidaceae bacterium]|nr:hypothetical protein [Bacteroidaceae bacterium]
MKKIYFVISIVCAFILGYGLCAVVGTLKTNKNLLDGDMSKTNVFSEQKSDPAMIAVVEQLQSDTTYFNATELCLGILQNRVERASQLADQTMSKCNDVPELQGMLNNVASLQAKAYNAKIAFKSTLAELQKVGQGEDASVFGQASDEAYAGYTKTETYATETSKVVYEALANYLKNKKGSEAEELATLASNWAKFSIENALLNANQEDVAFWINNVKKSKGLVHDTFAQNNLLKMAKDGNFDTIQYNNSNEKLMNEDLRMLREELKSEIFSNEFDNFVACMDGMVNGAFRWMQP